MHPIIAYAIARIHEQELRELAKRRRLHRAAGAARQTDAHRRRRVRWPLARSGRTASGPAAPHIEAARSRAA